MRRLIAVTMMSLLSLFSSTSAWAAKCNAADFAAAVDKSGASLRDFSIKAQPQLRDRIRRYAVAAKIPDTEPEDAALDAIQDAKLTSLDEKSAELLLKIDTLGRLPDASPPDCAKLEEIKILTRDMLAVMQQKSDYMLARLDAKIAATEKTEKSTANAPTNELADKSAKRSGIEEKALASPPSPPPSPKPPVQSWSTNTKPNDAYVPPEVAAAIPEPDLTNNEENGYSIAEIQDATRGFFGTVSTSLASVIEHAFKTSGRPTAYVLGTEGGGAFLAGLRFGKGTLFMRDQQIKREVYWHGPSLGTDFGASGSRTMFLIYRMRDPQALYRSFTGVDGSAYFVGGVGVTLLKGGDVIMAPIRSGLGLRVGANIGYVRFTDRATWNPF
ncbi:MAG: hypothetical protein CTY31_03465 [Hyphomicrobium sp.]|nr:MAG: hypothetical protein CTY39_11910 [Hyphomicrobium sp.]PPD01805.1 MAG: hypothetical protein CTY31_03465 [Hyphomicrobium sp.]